MPDSRFAFSNFERWRVRIDGIDYETLEHAYQAHKSTDWAERAAIAALSTPGEAKRAGRAVKHLDPNWEIVKIGLMFWLLKLKFELEPYRSRLVNYQQPIVEWNTWHDQEWGRCTCPQHKGKGKNILGILLAEVRHSLLRQDQIRRD